LPTETNRGAEELPGASILIDDKMANARSSFSVGGYVLAVVALGTLALGLSAASGISLPAAVPAAGIGVLAFCTLGILLQLAEHRLAVGTATGSIAFIVYLGAALLFGRFWGAVITAVSAAVAQGVARKPWIKFAFNVGQHVLSVVVAATVYEALGGKSPPEVIDESIIPFAGMVVVFFTINSTAVSAVVSLSEGRRFDEVWLKNTWAWVGYDLVASALALGIAWLYVRSGVVGMAIVVLPILFLRHTYLVNVQLQATNRELLELMVKAIEARDPYTSGHSQRVSEIARVLARELGLGFREVDNIATAALLHDVGKIYEEFAPILRKDGTLTPAERRTMESHPVRSAELVATISNLRGPVERCVRHHHENFDGSGYPDRIASDDIPLGARIVLVADTTDAMTTDRPYRKALSWERLLTELDRHSGHQFDPRVVAAFRRNLSIRRLVEARQLTPRREPDRDGREEKLVQLAAR